MRYFIAVFAGAIPLVPAIIYLVRGRHSLREATRETVIGFSVIDLLVALAMIGMGVAWLVAPDAVRASGLMQATPVRDPLVYMAAAVSVSVGSIGAGYAVGAVGAAALGTIAEKPEIFGRALLFVGLAEGVAIYGLVIAFIILGG